MKTLRYITILTLLALTLPSCLDQILPQSSNATAEQVAKADKMGLVNGLVQYMNTPVADATSSVYTGLGYPEHIIWHDVMTQDLPILSTGYNYWTAYSECLYMGNWAWQTYYWNYYNYLNYKAQLVIQNCARGNVDDAFAYATALAYRSFILFDMARMYEYRATGTSLDADYLDDLKGLTIPIVNENTTEDMAINNPRVPFYELYRYVLNDLDLAEEAINLTDDSAEKNYASPGMIYGLKARFWLELATRFDRHPDDLALQIQHDNEQYEQLGEGYQELPAIGVVTVNEAFANAAKYARLAIESGYKPLTRAEWYDLTSGFNTANSSWMWAVMISSSDKMCTYYTWESWVSFMCPEAEWGIACPEYRGSFMADAKLYASIDNADWRKLTWVDPKDWLPNNPTVEEEENFESTFNTKYSALTQMTFDNWKELGPYVAFKFRPGGGNTSASQSGNKVDIPLMRVEEMYLIEAEALAHTQGLGAGKSALENFVNSYRYDGGKYSCTSATMRDFEIEVVRQKRIEFWGEGVCLYDYKRLELPILRSYSGSNHPKSCQYNSLDGYVAPWTILYIPQNESRKNPALKLNPDPSGVMLELK